MSLGYPDQARAAGKEQLAIARRTHQAFNVVWALMGATRSLWPCDELELPFSHLEEVRARSQEFGLGLLIDSEMTVWHGLLMVYAQHLEEGEKELGNGIRLWRSTGWLHPIAEASAGRAAALNHLGRHAEAMSVVEEAIALIDGTGYRMFEADLHRVRGEILMNESSADAQSSEASLRRSLEIARSQHARGLELRAATSLAHLWQAHGKRREAYEMLAPIYNWFTEGFDTKDLKEAKALLEALSN